MLYRNVELSDDEEDEDDDDGDDTPAAESSLPSLAATKPNRFDTSNSKARDGVKRAFMVSMRESKFSRARTSGSNKLVIWMERNAAVTERPVQPPRPHH